MLPKGCEARCPGCAHRELSAEESEAAKLDWLKHALSPWEALIEPIRAPSSQGRWNYRDRTVLHAKRGVSRWEFGMRRPRRRGEREGEFVAIPRCPVHSERVRQAIAIFSEGMSIDLEMDLRFLVIAGPLATLVIKASPKNVEESSSLVLSAFHEIQDQLASRLVEAGIEGVFANFNPVAGRRVFSSRGWKHLWGARDAPHGPQSFQQLIPGLFEEALAESASWLAPARGDFVLDLYSGLGRSVQKWKTLGAESVGVELLGEAAGVLPDSVLRGRVSDRIPQLQERVEAWRASTSHAATSYEGHALTLFANPPRTGLEPEVLRWLTEWPAQAHPRPPQRIAYLSCSAGTLARDLSKLENCAYRVKRILPYDFFPQTLHVETLALVELDPAFRVPASLDGERLRRLE